MEKLASFSFQFELRPADSNEHKSRVERHLVLLINKG